MALNILFIGCGNIAFRNFQGLLSCNLNYNFFFFDINKRKFNKFQKHFQNSHRLNSKIFFSNRFNFDEKNIDLVLHCTTSDARLKYCELIIKKYNCKYIILEKVLSNNITSLLKIKKIFHNKKNVYVNTPRRSMNFYKKFKNKINLNKFLGIEIIGGKWGLACNTIHFIDLMSWMVGIKNYSFSDYDLGKWYKSKRKGFYDITGKININFNKYYLNVYSRPKNQKMKIILRFIDNKIEIFEQYMTYKINNITNKTKFEYQSELIKNHIYNILSKKKLELPSIKISVNQHLKYLDFFENVWCLKKKQKTKTIPIT